MKVRKDHEVNLVSPQKALAFTQWRTTAAEVLDEIAARLRDPDDDLDGVEWFSETHMYGIEEHDSASSASAASTPEPEGEEWSADIEQNRWGLLVTVESTYMTDCIATPCGAYDTYNEYALASSEPVVRCAWRCPRCGVTHSGELTDSDIADIAERHRSDAPDDDTCGVCRWK